MGNRGLRVNNSLGTKYEIKNLNNLSIDDQIKNLREQDVQQAYIYDSNGNVVQGYNGGDLGVYVAQKALDVEGGTLVYSHVAGGRADAFGGTFSPSAVKIFANSKLDRMVLSAQEGTYEFKAGPNANREAFSKAITRLNNLYKSGVSKKSGNPYKGIYERVYESAYNKAIKRYPGNPDRASRVARAQATNVYDREWKKFASKYGFTYTVTRGK